MYENNPKVENRSMDFTSIILDRIIYFLVNDDVGKLSERITEHNISKMSKSTIVNSTLSLILSVSFRKKWIQHSHLNYNFNSQFNVQLVFFDYWIKASCFIYIYIYVCVLTFYDEHNNLSLKSLKFKINQIIFKTKTKNFS